MMVTFVSQCEKKALSRTRRVLDSFANRIGDNTWQTVITNEGLNAVKKLLRKTASKSTAVSCFWIRSRSRSELVWVVGNRSKFNSEGVVPVNSTSKELMKESLHFNNMEVIALLAGIAGYFHDLGKANILFQHKLDPNKKGRVFEPYRHEWVSLRIFQAFINKQSDKEWLNALVNIDNSLEVQVIKQLEEVKDLTGNSSDNPFKLFESSQSIAKVIAWLIVSHHRLPAYPKKGDNQPPFEHMDSWLEELFDPLWNSTNIYGLWDKESNCYKQWDSETLKNNWYFPHGTPFNSAMWQRKISQLAAKALNTPNLFGQDWFNQRFTTHISRMALMLADHYYSSLPLDEITKDWQDPNYKAVANTDRETGSKKQKLDEHNIGVGEHAFKLVKKLTRLRADLCSLPLNKKEFINKVEKHFSIEERKKDHIKAIINNFKWQDTAFNLAMTLKEKAKDYGFFGINMASTGKGKTRGNARIMYALADENQGCRFSVALGLRTLTLQTGEALATHLNIKKNDELAVLIGSQAVKQLYEMSNGSDSEKGLMNDTEEVVYNGTSYEGEFSEWIKHDEKIGKLLQAPVLVSTIDYLIPATEGTRGGRQIAPMLRLLTSDLILDEPDDFGLEDLPALCRLVNWAGMLGSKVLLSTATMPPALAYALFQAYQAGRKEFTQVNGELGQTDKICCAWFDEFGSSKADDAIIDNTQAFIQQHSQFVDRRIKKLKAENKVLRRARLLPISCNRQDEVISTVAKTIQPAIHLLHDEHHQQHGSGKKVSIGLVRMANINPLVAVAKNLYSMPPQENYRIHYCVYHSQYPLAIRSHIENKLDAALNREDEDAIWLQDEIKQAIEYQPELNHIFVVLATSVAEVGRDHDYDWAIAEPSSMRSLIQLAGRIQRHRKKQPETENLLILSKNIKALKNKDVAYCRPGFESKGRQLVTHDLEDLLRPDQYQQIDAIPRIKKLAGSPKIENRKYCSFVELEQIALHQRLLGAGKTENKASYWWENQPTWCGELQRRQVFRKSAKDSEYCRYFDKENNKLIWKKLKKTTIPPQWNVVDEIQFQEFNIHDNNSVWFDLDTENIYMDLANMLQFDLEKINKQFGVVRLREDDKKVIRWCYHNNLGVFNDV